MQIQNIVCANFGVAAPPALSLPDKGLVLITGPNGTGKSTYVEAVSAAVWGKNLRGEDLWLDGRDASVSVTCGGELTITRERNKKGKQAVHVFRGGVEQGPYDTATAAQQALAFVGTHNRWANTCVFRSSDVDRFSSATDAERKALLEELLGLGRLERASAAARLETKAAAGALSAAQTALSAAQYAHNNARDALARASDVVAAAPPAVTGEVTQVEFDAMRARGGLLQTHLANLQGEIDALGVPARAAQQALADARASMRAATAKLAALEHRGECPTCGQEVGPTLVASLRGACADAEAAALAAAEAATKLSLSADAEIEAIKVEQQESRSAVAEIQQALSAASAAQRTRDAFAASQAAAERSVAAATTALADAAAKIETLQGTLEAATQEATLAGLTEKVLGTRGVRAALSTKLLNAVEGAANFWLGHLSDQKWALELSGSKELKGGGMSDVIAMTVHGVAGGKGYKAMSTGQRRRVDMALLLGLAEVTAPPETPDTAAGSSTLWFDECMDGVDEAGVDAVCTLLTTLAQDRCVVVISHSDVLVAGLVRGAAKHLDLTPT